eukprot:2312537-Prymnesium_polylepis.1
MYKGKKLLDLWCSEADQAKEKLKAYEKANKQPAKKQTTDKSDKTDTSDKIDKSDKTDKTDKSDGAGAGAKGRKTEKGT